eukprot:Hpha_TRINITY_DN16823_c1_g2::TRINITY_DN16823_c1_g2_i11::g.150346::m.150346
MGGGGSKAQGEANNASVAAAKNLSPAVKNVSPAAKNVSPSASNKPASPGGSALQAAIGGDIAHTPPSSKSTSASPRSAGRPVSPGKKAVLGEVVMSPPRPRPQRIAGVPIKGGVMLPISTRGLCGAPGDKPVIMLQRHNAVPPLPPDQTTLDPVVAQQRSRRISKVSSGEGTPMGSPRSRSAQSDEGLLPINRVMVDAQRPLLSAHALHTSGMTDLALGEGKKAAGSLAQCLRLRVAVLGSTHPSIPCTQLSLARALRGAKSIPAAILMLRLADSRFRMLGEDGGYSHDVTTPTEEGSAEAAAACEVFPADCRATHLEVKLELSECFQQLAHDSSGGVEDALLGAAVDALLDRADLLQKLPYDEHQGPLWIVQVLELRRLALLEERRGNIEKATAWWQQLLEVSENRRKTAEDGPRLVTYQGKHSAKREGGVSGWHQALGQKKLKSPDALSPSSPSPSIGSPSPIRSPGDPRREGGEDPKDDMAVEAEQAVYRAKEHIRRLQKDPVSVVDAAREKSGWFGTLKPLEKRVTIGPSAADPAAGGAPAIVSPTIAKMNNSFDACSSMALSNKASTLECLPSHFVGGTPGAGGESLGSFSKKNSELSSKPTVLRPLQDIRKSIDGQRRISLPGTDVESGRTPSESPPESESDFASPIDVDSILAAFLDKDPFAKEVLRLIHAPATVTPPGTAR